MCVVVLLSRVLLAAPQHEVVKSQKRDPRLAPAEEKTLTKNEGSGEYDDGSGDDEVGILPAFSCKDRCVADDIICPTCLDQPCMVYSETTTATLGIRPIVIGTYYDSKSAFATCHRLCTEDHQDWCKAFEVGNMGVDDDSSRTGELWCALISDGNSMFNAGIRAGGKGWNSKFTLWKDSRIVDVDLQSPSQEWVLQCGNEKDNHCDLSVAWNEDSAVLVSTIRAQFMHGDPLSCYFVASLDVPDSSSSSGSGVVVPEDNKKVNTLSDDSTGNDGKENRPPPSPPSPPPPPSPNGADTENDDTVIDDGGGKDQNEDSKAPPIDSQLLITIVAVSSLLVLGMASSIVAYKRKRMDLDAMEAEISMASLNNDDDHGDLILDEKGFHPMHYAVVKGSVDEIEQILLTQQLQEQKQQQYHHHGGADGLLGFQDSTTQQYHATAPGGGADSGVDTPPSPTASFESGGSSHDGRVVPSYSHAGTSPMMGGGEGVIANHGTPVPGSDLGDSPSADLDNMLKEVDAEMFGELLLNENTFDGGQGDNVLDIQPPSKRNKRKLSGNVGRTSYDDVELSLSLISTNDQEQQAAKVATRNQSLLVDVKDRSGNTPVAWSIRAGHHHVLEFLLLKNANPDIANHEHISPLHSACMLGVPFSFIASLLQRQVTVNAQDDEGRTALIYAAGQGSVDTVKLLMQAGADVLVQSRHGLNALMSAAMHCHERVVLELLTHPSIETQVQDSHGRTALYWACSIGATNCVSALVTKDLESTFIEADNGDSPCHASVLSGHAACIDTVFAALSERQRRKLLNLTNAAGLTLEALAQKQKRAVCLEILFKYRQTLTDDMSQTMLATWNMVHSTCPQQPNPNADVTAVSPEMMLGVVSPFSSMNNSPANSVEHSDGKPAGGKTKRSAEQQRERRRTYMRQKRAEEAQLVQQTELRVQALAHRNSELADMVQRMREEANMLKMELGIVAAGDVQMSAHPEQLGPMGQPTGIQETILNIDVMDMSHNPRSSQSMML